MSQAIYSKNTIKDASYQIKHGIVSGKEKFVSMFTTFIVQPIFNVLTIIYALLPGHNFGMAIILFTILTRILLYPLLKKQLRHTKAMRDLQPEIKRIKKASKGNKQQEQLMMMELYKEREIKPMAYLGLMVLQVVIFLALFQGLNRVVKNPQELINFSYPFVQSMPAMEELATDPSQFDNTLFGFVDLSRAAVEEGQDLYLPALFLVLGSALIQFLQIRQTMPSDKNARKLREILKSSSDGDAPDTAEINAAMGKNMAYIMPVLIFVLTIGFPAALSLYWFVGGIIAYFQQSYLLKQDEFAMNTPQAEVVSKKPLKANETVTKSGVKVIRNPQAETKTTKKGTTKTPVKTGKSKAKKRR